MIRKFAISVFFFLIYFNVAFIYQDNLNSLYDENFRFDYFRKVFGKIDSILRRTKISPPKDTAKIQVTVYPPINTGKTKDYKHRLGAYEAWEKGKTLKEGNYPAIIDSLKLVKDKIDVDWRLLANCYYRLNKINMALNAGEKIRRPDGRTLYAMGLLALELQQYERAAMHFKKAVDIKPDLIKAYTRLGDAFYIINKHDSALTNWLIAKKKGDDEPYINYFIGSIYFEKNNLDEASKCFADLKGVELEDNWYIRSRYLQALIEEKKGNRASALQILSEINIITIDTSSIEYDILKKKIYSHFWIGLSFFSKNRELSKKHFKRAKSLINLNHEVFQKNDRYLADLLEGVLQRLIEEVENKKLYVLSNNKFRKYTNKILTAYSEHKVNDQLIRVSAEVLYHCREPFLASQFFKELTEKDDIAKMNYYVLQPANIKKFPPKIEISCNDILAPYIFYNYMIAFFQAQQYIKAESFFFKTIKCIEEYCNSKNLDGLLYASYFCRARWLKDLMSDQPVRYREDMENTKKEIDRLINKNPNLYLHECFYLKDGRLFIMAVSK